MNSSLSFLVNDTDDKIAFTIKVISPRDNFSLSNKKNPVLPAFTIVDSLNLSNVFSFKST